MSKSIRKFTADTLITITTRVLQLFLGIGIFVIIARILGPELKGVYSLAILLPSLLVSFGTFGIGQASIFYIGSRKYPPKDIFATNIILSFFLGIVGFLIGLIIIIFFSSALFPEVEKGYLILALFLIPLQLCFTVFNRFLLGLQKIKQFNIVSILQVLAFLIFLSIFLLFKAGVSAAIIAYVSSYLVGIAVSVYLAYQNISDFHWHFNKLYACDAFTYGFKISLGNAIGTFRYKINIFLVNAFLDPIAVGLYVAAVEISEKIWLISQSAGLVLFPRVSSETDKKKLKELTPLVCRNVIFVTLLGAFFLLFAGRFLIVLLYSDKFLDSVLPFQILLVGVVAMSGGKVLSNDLYGRNRPELNIYINSITIILNIILNILWISKYGIIGASWATSISYIVSFLSKASVYARISGNRIRDLILPGKIDFIMYRDLICRVFGAENKSKLHKS
jgi:O-antigen/teichoic acid export membrane protein